MIRRIVSASILYLVAIAVAKDPDPSVHEPVAPPSPKHEPTAQVESRPAQTESEKIESLISLVENLPDAVFIRNDEEHDCKAAAKHMRDKWEWKQGEIKTARDFIRVAATKSSMSGRPYLIRFKDGRRIASADHLLKELERLEQPLPTPGSALRLPIVLLEFESPERLDSRHGIHFVLWPDGHAICRQQQGTYCSGKVDERELNKLIGEFRTLDIFSQQEQSYLVPDAGYFSFAARDGDKKCLWWWDEVESPGYGANIRPTPEYLAFVRKWKLVRRLIRDSRPKECVHVGDKIEEIIPAGHSLCSTRQLQNASPPVETQPGDRP